MSRNKTPMVNNSPPFLGKILPAKPRENFGLFSYQFWVGNLKKYPIKKGELITPFFYVESDFSTRVVLFRDTTYTDFCSL